MEYRYLKHTLHELVNIRKGRASFKVIRRRMLDGASIDGIHVCQLIAAMIIASIGLNTDSTEAVIGAMLICPLMGSVLAMAYAVSTVDKKLFRDSVVGLVLQVAVCLLTSTFYFALTPISQATSELVTNSDATVWDLLIAVVGGFAGALGTSRTQEPSTLVAGVAVATALMPPLCSTGYGLAMRDLGIALAAFYEFMINVVFIGFGAGLVMVWLHAPLQSDINGDGVVTDEERAEAQAQFRSLRTRVLAFALAFAIPCVFLTANLVRDAVAQNDDIFQVPDAYDVERTTRELDVLYPQLEDYRIGEEESFEAGEGVVRHVVATVVSSDPLEDKDRRMIERLVRINVPSLDQITFEVAGEAT